MPENRIFVLGVGAQKAGTTWLYHYLASSQHCAAFKIKEYHIWDAVHIPCCSHFAVSEDKRRDPAENLRFRMQRSPDLYFDYFAGLLDLSGRQMTMDITPSYMGLSRSVLSQIRSGFEQRRIVTRAVLLMRDPVERCWSSARMSARGASGHTRVSGEQLIAHAKSVEAEMRTRYDLAWHELTGTFGEGGFHAGLYEEMQQPDKLERLSAFCGVEFRPDYADRRMNQNPKDLPVSTDCLREVALHYRDVYAFMAERIPAALDLWPRYRYL